MLDDRTRTNQFGGLAFWSGEDNVTSWTAYLGDGAGAAGDWVSPYAASARVELVHGLPPLYLNCVQIDICALEDVKYAMRFMETNIPIELHVYEGFPHWFEGFAPTSGAMKRAFANRASAMTTF